MGQSTKGLDLDSLVGNSDDPTWGKIPKKGAAGAPEWLSRLSVQLLVLAQVMISWFMSLSPALGSVLTVQNLPGILSLPLSLSK